MQITRRIKGASSLLWVIRYSGEPAAGLAIAAMPPKTEVNSEHQRRHCGLMVLPVLADDAKAFFKDRVGARPAVQAALTKEGLMKAA